VQDAFEITIMILSQFISANGVASILFKICWWHHEHSNSTGSKTHDAFK